MQSGYITCSMCGGVGVITVYPRSGYEYQERDTEPAPSKSTSACTLCNGTGKMFGGYAPEYTSSTTKKWCDICNKADYPHYHKKCISCDGTGRS
jgi:DnaJ-class molecular chaperone